MTGAILQFCAYFFLEFVVYEFIFCLAYLEVRKALKARRLQKTSKTQSESFKNTRVDHSIEVGLEAAEIESGITTVDHHQVMIRVLYLR